MQHFHLLLFSRNVTYGLMYVRHLLHLAMTWSVTTGTACSSSSSAFTLRYGVTTSASGILHFLNRPSFAGTAPSVLRCHEKCELILGECEKEAYVRRFHQRMLQKSQENTYARR